MTIAPAALVASTVGFGGSVSVGAVVSRTVTVKLFVATFARVSGAEQVTVVVASGNVAPLAGVQLAATAPLTASVAVALNVTIAPAAPVASAVVFGGSVSVGAVVSRTVTVKLFVPALA